MFNNAVSPRVANVTFQSNRAVYGGALLNYGNMEATFINVRFLDNYASDNGGAVGGNNGAKAHFVSVEFLNNSTFHLGGAVTIFNSEVTLMNALFVGNQSTNNGAAIANRGDSSLSVVNASFINNSSTNGAAVLLNNSLELELVATATIVNSIFYGNSSGEGTKPDIVKESGDVTLSYNLIEGGCSGLSGAACDTTNIDGTPEFVDEAAKDYRLSECSIGVDGGDSGLLPMDALDADENGVTNELISVDLAGERRVFGAGVDIGAFETQSSCSSSP